MSAPMTRTKKQEEEILRAARFGDDESVKKEVGNFVNLNVQDNDGCTPLHHAAENGHASTVALLIRAGALNYVKNKNGKYPMDLVSETDPARKEISHFLSSRGKKNPYRPEVTPARISEGPTQRAPDHDHVDANLQQATEFGQNIRPVLEAVLKGFVQGLETKTAFLSQAAAAEKEDTTTAAAPTSTTSTSTSTPPATTTASTLSLAVNSAPPATSPPPAAPVTASASSPAPAPATSPSTSTPLAAPVPSPSPTPTPASALAPAHGNSSSSQQQGAWLSALLSHLPLPPSILQVCEQILLEELKVTATSFATFSPALMRAAFQRIESVPWREAVLRLHSVLHQAQLDAIPTPPQPLHTQHGQGAQLQAQGLDERMSELSVQTESPHTTPTHIHHHHTHHHGSVRTGNPRTIYSSLSPEEHSLRLVRPVAATTPPVHSTKPLNRMVTTPLTCRVPMPVQRSVEAVPSPLHSLAMRVQASVAETGKVNLAHSHTDTGTAQETQERMRNDEFHKRSSTDRNVPIPAGKKMKVFATLSEDNKLKFASPRRPREPMQVVDPASLAAEAATLL